ncbi:MAG: ketoacyl-ACP synthase III [Pirellulales bacterium]|nr:ketoacyl-ACP synthase III [Pirellulales bacterium]
MRRLMGFRIVSTGSYVPERVVTNEELAQTFGYDADWIVQRTGIVTRHLAAPDEATSDLALRAAQRAIERAGVQAEDIDLLVLATATPDTSGTSSAALVQDRLGLGCQAFDVTAACAGFMYALTTAAQYVVTGCSKLALVIGADTMSRVCNPADQRSAPLFGDGAGAVLLSAGTPQQGFESYALGSDGSGSGYLHRPMGGSRMPIDPNRLGEGLQYMQMDGRAVFKWAIQLLSYNIPAVLEHAGCAVSDMDLFVLHQANERIISAAAENLGLPPERIFMNVQRVGNTTAGSVPLALDEAIAAGRVRPGNRVLLSAFGAGLAWGTAVLRW